MNKNQAEVKKILAEIKELESRNKFSWTSFIKYGSAGIIVAAAIIAAWFSIFKELSESQVRLSSLKLEIAEYELKKILIQKDSVNTILSLQKVKLENLNKSLANSKKKSDATSKYFSDKYKKLAYEYQKLKQNVSLLADPNKKTVIIKALDVEIHAALEESISIGLSMRFWRMTRRYKDGHTVINLIDFGSDGLAHLYNEGLGNEEINKSLNNYWSLKRGKLDVTFGATNQASKDWLFKIHSTPFNTYSGKGEHRNGLIFDWFIEELKED